jgi:hypothetical protein
MFQSGRKLSSKKHSAPSIYLKNPTLSPQIALNKIIKNTTGKT